MLFVGKLLTGMRDNQSWLVRSSGRFAEAAPHTWKCSYTIGCARQGHREAANRLRKEIPEGHKESERQKAGKEIKAAARAREAAGLRFPHANSLPGITGSMPGYSCQGMAREVCAVPAAVSLSLQNKC